MLLALAGCHRAVKSDAQRTEGGSDRPLRTFSATLRVVLDLEPDGPLELDGVMVAEFPHFYRLQLWKLSRPVLDITRTRRGTWVLNRLSEEGAHGSKLLEAAPFQEGVASIAKGLRLARELRERGDRRCSTAREDERVLECCMSSPSSDDISCTLRQRRGTIASIDFRAFRRIGPSDWPTEVHVDSDWGSLRLEFEHIENEPLGPEAFTPPRNARRIR
jgi:hypothetical protein